MPDIFLLLGSNLGDREKHLCSAAKLIDSQIGPVSSFSSYYETSAWGKTDQPDFINQVLRLSAEIPAIELLERVLSIEKRLGRTREERWGSRIIDIDILFYGSETLNFPDLVIPHKLLHQRRFALMPLYEIAPDFIHPVLNKSIKEILLQLADPLSVKKLKNYS